MKLKKLYSSREVAQLTGLSARQLRWWAQRKIFLPAVASHKTESGGFTERRYTPIELLELMVLADLRRRDCWWLERWTLREMRFSGRDEGCMLSAGAAERPRRVQGHPCIDVPCA